jgi:hypothetical protein
VGLKLKDNNQPTPPTIWSDNNDGSDNGDDGDEDFLSDFPF